MSVRVAWSAAEDDALLRAWADVVERRPKSQAKELLQAYNALCDASVRQERTSAALQTRRNMFLRMRDIICAFHAHIQQQQQQTTNQGGDDKGEKGDPSDNTTGEASSTVPVVVPPASLPEDAPRPEFSSDDWFELTLGEQRRWFASLDTKSYPFHEIQRDHFERVEAIYKLSADHGRRDLSRRKATYTRPQAEKEEQEEQEEQEQGQEGDEGDDDAGDYDFARDPLSTAHIRATIDRLKQKKLETKIVQPAQRKRYGGCIQPHRYRDSMPEKEDSDATTKADSGGGSGSGNTNAAVSDDGDNNSDGGSSTESDDEILSCWDENGDAVVPRGPVMVTTDVKAEPASSIKTLQEDPFEQHSDQQSPHKQVDDVVDPDLLELASILETQARHLGEIFRQTKKARKEESRGRRYIMKNIQIDREERKKVLEDLKRRDEELRREREQWQVEKSNMKRELARLREQMTAKHQEAALERPE